MKPILLLVAALGLSVLRGAEPALGPDEWIAGDTGSMRPYCDTGDHVKNLPGNYKDINKGSLIIRWVAWENGGKGGRIAHVAWYKDSLGWITHGINNVDWNGHAIEDHGHMGPEDFKGFWTVTWHAPTHPKHKVNTFQRE